MQKQNLLPTTGFVRLPTILNLIPVGKSTWWEGVKTGRFPKPVKLGPRTTAWRAEDIQELINQYPSCQYSNTIKDYLKDSAQTLTCNSVKAPLTKNLLKTKEAI